jgi:hypothetical protein
MTPGALKKPSQRLVMTPRRPEKAIATACDDSERAEKAIATACDDSGRAEKAIATACDDSEAR